MNISKMTIDEIIALLDGELKASCGMGFEFRSHQIEAIKNYLKAHYGLFNITCGVGKTLIQACIIYLEILRCKELGIPFKGLFVCHRLMLEDQIKTEYTKFFGEFLRTAKIAIRVLNTTGDNSLENIARNDMAMPMGCCSPPFSPTPSRWHPFSSSCRSCSRPRALTPP